MKNRNSRMGAYLREAEESFLNANGNYEDAFAAAGYEYDDAFAAAGDYMFNPMNANGSMGKAPVRIPDFDRTYTVTVTNANPDTQPVVLFGANQFLLAANFGNVAGVTVAVGESSYLEMLQESQDYTFISSGFRITSANTAQLDQVLSVEKRTGNGQRCSYPIQVSNYFSAFQFQAGIREVYPYNIEFAGTTNMQFNILGNTTVVFTFFVGKRMDTRNDLKNRSSIEVSTHKLPFVRKQEVVLEAAPSTSTPAF